MIELFFTKFNRYNGKKPTLNDLLGSDSKEKEQNSKTDPCW
jgi:hypothetical protein